MPRIEFDLTLTGGAGAQVVSQIITAESARLGELRSVIIRYVSGDHTFTAATGQFRIGLFPKALTATEVPDRNGRPTVAPNVITAVPDERVVYRPGAALTIGTPQPLTAYHSDQIAVASRRMADGPLSCTLQATVATGAQSVHRVSLEFGDAFT